jgi:hypothetical protein
MVWVNPPNRVALYLYQAHSQSSTPLLYKMFNQAVDPVLRKSLCFLGCRVPCHSEAQRSRGISNFFCVAIFELAASPQQRETSLDMTSAEQESKNAANSCG